MESLDLKQLAAMVQVIADEKGLPEETVLDIVQMAIAAAWRKDHGDREMNVRAILDMNSGKATVFVGREVVEDGVAYNPATEMPLAEARKLKSDAEVGETVEESMEVSDFGRVAAMTAKQVVVQRLREAERDAVLAGGWCHGWCRNWCGCTWGWRRGCCRGGNRLRGSSTRWGSD